jgi:hypothetical protein
VEYRRTENKMKKSKELEKKNEDKEFKKQIPKDRAANIITKDIIFSQLKSNQKKIIKIRRLVI